MHKAAGDVVTSRLPILDDVNDSLHHVTKPKRVMSLTWCHVNDMSMTRTTLLLEMGWTSEVSLFSEVE